ncbi:MAG: hypothetical protein PHP37_02605 [Patescibacteria group bacterium]|nr:hypothetical protein [Patescibacteria group bacterium]
MSQDLKNSTIEEENKKEHQDKDIKEEKNNKEAEEFEQNEQKEEEIDLQAEGVVIKKSFSDKLNDFFAKKIKNNLELLETDLIKGEVEIQFNWRKNLITFFILFFVALVIVVEACLFLTWWGKQKESAGLNYLQEEIAYVKKESANLKVEYDKAMEFNKRLNLSSNTLKNHIYWTNFFSLLEANTLKNVYYSSFSGNIYGNYILPAQSDNVLAISYQSKIFSSNDKVISTSISNENIVNDDENSKSIINFNFNLNLKKEIFN